MRRAINPDMDEKRRTENSLQIWILEAKGVPQKRRYFCDLVLDTTLYAKTSVKTHAEHCFWGDFFDLKGLPPTKTVIVNLYREADPKKKKDNRNFLGFVKVNIDQFKASQPLEKWFTVTTSNDNSSRSILTKNTNELVSIRIKARYQTVDVLPLTVYNRLTHFIKLNYLSLCHYMEPCLGVKYKEDFATFLVKILHRQRVVKDFLCDIIMAEVEQLDNDHLMFRGNSLATKSMEAYIKLVAADYLNTTLGAFVKRQVNKPLNFEVDPTRLQSTSQSTLDGNRRRLMEAVEECWACIVRSSPIFPRQLREVFDGLRRRLDSSGKSQLSDKLVSASIFLRYLCPAVLSPSLFGLATEYPSEQAIRNLTLIAKTLQTLANFTKFGGKESFMEFMNNFVVKETQPMHTFLVCISHPPLLSEKAMTVSNNDIDSEIDLGKELSCLHSYLEEHWTPQLHTKASAEDENMAELQAIIAEIDMCRTREYTPQGTLSSYSASHSSTNPPSDYENNGKPSNGFHKARRSLNPAVHLNTNDDYVIRSAVGATNDGSKTANGAGLYPNSYEANERSRIHRQMLANRRSLPYPKPDLQFHPIYDDTPSSSSVATTSTPRPSIIRDGYVQHLYDEVSNDPTTPSAKQMTPRHPQTVPLLSHDPAADDEATDTDDEEKELGRRITPKKTRRKSYLNEVRMDMPEEPRRTVAAQIPSSGYHSQNQSCYSSTSSSPVESFIQQQQKNKDPELGMVTTNSSTNGSNANVPTMNYPTATTTSCSSSSSSAAGCPPDLDESTRRAAYPYAQRLSSSGVQTTPRFVVDNQHLEPSPFTKTRSNYRAKSVTALVPRKEAILTPSGSCLSMGASRASYVEPEVEDLIAEQRRQIDDLLRENESLKRALAEHDSQIELSTRVLTNSPYSVQLSPF